jgi:hypothetical protein
MAHSITSWTCARDSLSTTEVLYPFRRLPASEACGLRGKSVDRASGHAMVRAVSDELRKHLSKARAGAVVTPRAVGTVIIAAGFILCLVLNLPGQLSYDSVAQLHDGHFGIYNGWHPPVMAWMLGIADDIVPGAGVFVIFDAVLAFGTLAALLRFSPRPAWPAVAVASACVLLPQFLLYQGIVWKDVLFADAALAGFVCIAHAGEKWRRPHWRNRLLSLGLVLLVLAALARQNGAIVLVFGILTIAVLAAVQAPAAFRLRTGLMFGAVVSLAALGLVLPATFALATRTPGESGPRAQFKLLETYDIVGAVKEKPGLSLDRIARANPDLEQLIRADGVRLYTPQRNDTLASSAELQDELSDTPSDVVSTQWRELIVQHPWLYLDVRARVFGWTLFTPDISRCAPVFVGVDGLPRFMRDLHLASRMRPQDAALKAYGALLVDTPVFSHITYLLLALATLVVLLRRGRPADLAIACLLMSAIAFTLSFFVISIACDYRYLVFLDLSAVAGILYLTSSRPKSA